MRITVMTEVTMTDGLRAMIIVIAGNAAIIMVIETTVIIIVRPILIAALGAEIITHSQIMVAVAMAAVVGIVVMEADGITPAPVMDDHTTPREDQDTRAVS